MYQIMDLTNLFSLHAGTSRGLSGAKAGRSSLRKGLMSPGTNPPYISKPFNWNIWKNPILDQPKAKTTEWNHLVFCSLKYPANNSSRVIKSVVYHHFTAATSLEWGFFNKCLWRGQTYICQRGLWLDGQCYMWEHDTMHLSCKTYCVPLILCISVAHLWPLHHVQDYSEAWYMNSRCFSYILSAVHIFGE